MQLPHQGLAAAYFPVLAVGYRLHQKEPSEAPEPQADSSLGMIAGELSPK